LCWVVDDIKLYDNSATSQTDSTSARIISSDTNKMFKATFDPKTDIPDQSGRVFLVTGGRRLLPPRSPILVINSVA
jgi:hypothetical protein